MYQTNINKVRKLISSELTNVNCLLSTLLELEVKKDVLVKILKLKVKIKAKNVKFSENVITERQTDLMV